MTTSTTYPIKAVRTSFRVIEALKQLDGAGVSEVAEHLDIPDSTAHDHLQTLERSAYLLKDADDTYRLSARFLEFGGYARSRMGLYTIAKPELDDLAHKTGEISNLMIEEHGQGIFLAVAKGQSAVEIEPVHHTGMRVYLQTTALGKSILAHLPEERIEQILDAHGLPEITNTSITDRDELFDELDEIRDRGYAIDNEERVEGMRCVAAPITTSAGVIGAISVSGPTKRMQGDRFDTELPERIFRSANVIQVTMEHQ